MKTFIINNNQGIYFSKKSGDLNKIHIDKKYAYNSQFGEIIVHGSLAIIKIISILNKEFGKRIDSHLILKFSLINFIKYNIELHIIKKNKDQYIIKQNNKIVILLEIGENILNYDLGKITHKKNLNFHLDNKFNIKDMKILLMELSKYVGMIYPGENSLIRTIAIQYYDLKRNKKIIHSWKDDIRIPIIKNEILFNNYKIFFETIERPTYVEKKNNIDSSLLKKVKKLKGNYLVIGGSMGIGKEVTKLLSHNKKIKIYSSYFHNKIKYLKNNVKFIRIDIKKDLYKIQKIINKKDFNVYYFATPKITLDRKNKELERIYNSYYIKYVIELVKIMKSTKQKYNFFYPSTDFINTYGKDIYTLTKAKAEKKLKLETSKAKNINLQILRVPRVNTKQNISIIKSDLPSFTDLLNKNIEYQNKILFRY